MALIQEPPRTGFEFSWRVLGIRYRVLPSFFLISGLLIAVIGYIHGLTDPVALAFLVAINVACLAVGILFTTSGQALVYKTYGLRSVVYIRELMGGVYPEAQPGTALQRIIVALASPASAFLLLALVYYSDEYFPWAGTNVITRITYFILTALGWFWGIIGLLPIYPYSGGQVMLEVMQLLMPRRGLEMTLVISILVGVAYVAYSALVYLKMMREVVLFQDKELPASIIVAVFFALSVMQNWSLLAMVRSHRPRLRVTRDDDYDDDRPPWNR